MFRGTWSQLKGSYRLEFLEGSEENFGRTGKKKGPDATGGILAKKRGGVFNAKTEPALWMFKMRNEKVPQR